MVMVMIIITHDDNCEFPDGSNPSMSVKLHCRQKKLFYPTWLLERLNLCDHGNDDDDDMHKS